MKLKTLLVFLVVMTVGTGCGKKSPPQRDIVLELAASMNGVLDTHRTHGRELYSRYCSVCHGINGEGDGFNAFNLTPRPRNFTDSAFVARMDTTLIRETISGGGKAVGLSALMPTWGHTLSHSDIRELSDYIVYLSKRGSGADQEQN